MTADRHLLIVGAGSVGRRHARNFRMLGCRLSAVDPRTDRLSEAAAEGPLERTYADFEHALSDVSSLAGVVICSPPKFHVTDARRALEAGVPVYLEKPVSPRAHEAALLMETQARTGTPLLLGYTYRWWPALQELRSRLLRGVIGKVLHVKCVMSAHLADWHPWEPYQEFFMASRELGGGALLDESHFVDLMLWFFGRPIEVFARVEHLSSLEIETDDNVDALLAYPAGLRVYVHLDLFGRPHEKYILATGDAGTLHWSFEPNRIRLARSTGPEWVDSEFSGERNDMFAAAAAEFLKVLAGCAPSCTAQDGYRVLQVIEAMRQSSATGSIVDITRGA